MTVTELISYYVNHNGTVKGEGDNLIADVAFKGVGIKSLSVKYAPMEIIK